MSVPHTGRIEAEIQGRRCSFDGDAWSAADSSLAETLNLVTEMVPKTHYTIQEIAEAVFRRAGLAGSARIISARNDNWTEELPEGAVD